MLRRDAVIHQERPKNWTKCGVDAIVSAAAFLFWVTYNCWMPVHLTPRERAHLKARAHPLEPTVQVGHGGLSDSVAAEIDRALTAHELIKVKVHAADREAREALCDAICARSDAAEVQRVGRVLVIWRPRPLDENPQPADN